MYIFYEKKTIFINILYEIPDFRGLFQEITIQIEEYNDGNFSNVKKFLNFWDSNIDGMIKEVKIFYGSDEIRYSELYNDI